MQRTKLETTSLMIKTTPYRPDLGLAALKSREKCLGLTSCYPDEPDDTQRWQDFNLLFWAERKKPPDADEEMFDWAKGSSILKAQHWSQAMCARPSKTCRSCRQSSEGQQEKVNWDKPATERDETQRPSMSHSRGLWDSWSTSTFIPTALKKFPSDSPSTESQNDLGEKRSLSQHCLVHH